MRLLVCGGPTWKAKPCLQPRCHYCKSPIPIESLHPKHYYELLNKYMGLYTPLSPIRPELNVRIYS